MCLVPQISSLNMPKVVKLYRMCLTMMVERWQLVEHLKENFVS